MEMGIRDAPALRYQLFERTAGRWFSKRWAEQAIDGLRRTLPTTRSPAGAPRQARTSAEAAPPAG
jgi:hypothetical protein